MSQFYERRGAHRPSGLGPAGTIPWLIAAVVVVLIVTYATGLWGGGSGGGTSAASSTGSGPTTSASTSKTPSTTSTGSTTSVPSSTSSGSSSSTSGGSTVDHDQPVTVLNSTKRSGLAASAAGTLKNAGWTVRATGNYRTALSTTTVFYGRSSLHATAEAVAKDLGGNAVTQESADFGSSRVTAVIGDDYQG